MRALQYTPRWGYALALHSMFVLRARGRVPAPDPGRNNTALHTVRKLWNGRVWSSRREKGSNSPQSPSALRHSSVSFDTALRSCPVCIYCPGWGTDLDDPSPGRSRACPARLTTESRPVCHEPRRWWAMHSRRISLTATNQVAAPCASASSQTRRYEPGGRCVAPRYLSIPVSLDIPNAIHAMYISTGYDKLLISPGRPHSGGVRPSST